MPPFFCEKNGISVIFHVEHTFARAPPPSSLPSHVLVISEVSIFVGSSIIFFSNTHTPLNREIRWGGGGKEREKRVNLKNCKNGKRRKTGAKCAVHNG